MAELQQERPRSFKAFVNIIEEHRSRGSGVIWYRGCGNARYQLLPALYRHKIKKTIGELIGLESDLINWFRQRSIPFHTRSLRDDWETLFFMQHYGVPTRLLDWTENPFVAFFFAVISAQKLRNKQGRVSFNADAALWILDPVAWNRHALSYLSFDEGVLSGDHDALIGYKPTEKLNLMGNHAVAMYGAHNSQRIVAQRGVFTVFGKKLDPMERIFEKDSFPEHALVKVTLPRTNLPNMYKTILDYGVTESVVFPDLEGFAKEMKRQFDFEV